MLKSTALLAAFAALTVALPAQAGDTQANTAGDKAEQPKPKTICRRETFVGSNLPKKTCKTEAEWKAQDEQARRQFSERDRDGN